MSDGRKVYARDENAFDEITRVSGTDPRTPAVAVGGTHRRRRGNIITRDDLIQRYRRVFYAISDASPQTGPSSIPPRDIKGLSKDLQARLRKFGTADRVICTVQGC